MADIKIGLEKKHEWWGIKITSRIDRQLGCIETNKKKTKDLLFHSFKQGVSVRYKLLGPRRWRVHPHPSSPDSSHPHI